MHTPAKHFLLGCVALVMIATTRGDTINLAATLFRQTDAEQIFSGELEAASYNTKPDGEGAGTRISQCGYVWKKNSRQVAHVDLSLRQWKTPEVARAQFEGMKLVYRGTDVNGLGDAAFRSPSPAQLHVLKGRTWITVTAGTFKAEPEKEAVIATIALGRIND
jgi:hypothetical protein